AHLKFTRINIDAPTILGKTIEDWREAGALMSIASSTSRDWDVRPADDAQEVSLSRSSAELASLNDVAATAAKTCSALRSRRRSDVSRRRSERLSRFQKTSRRWGSVIDVSALQDQASCHPDPQGL